MLRGSDLTWTAFVPLLWVVWVWGESGDPARRREAGISKGHADRRGPHAGVARGLLRRAGHPTDGRLVLLA